MPDIRTVYVQLSYSDGTKSYLKCEMDIDDSIEDQVFDLNEITGGPEFSNFTWSLSDWRGHQTAADTKLEQYINEQRTDK